MFTRLSFVLLSTCIVLANCHADFESNNNVEFSGKHLADNRQFTPEDIQEIINTMANAGVNFNQASTIAASALAAAGGPLSLMAAPVPGPYPAPGSYPAPGPYPAQGSYPAPGPYPAQGPNPAPYAPYSTTTARPAVYATTPATTAPYYSPSTAVPVKPHVPYPVYPAIPPVVVPYSNVMHKYPVAPMTTPRPYNPTTARPYNPTTAPTYNTASNRPAHYQYLCRSLNQQRQVVFPIDLSGLSMIDICDLGQVVI